MGHRVTFYEKDVEYYRRHRDLATCDYCNLVLYDSWENVRRGAIAEAAESDVVLASSYLPEGACINDEILALDRPLRVFYDLDTPITLGNLDADGVEYLRRDQMPEFDLYLSFTGGRILERLEREYRVRRAAPIYGCVDPDVHSRTAVREDFRCDLSYMGTYAPDRQAKLDALFLEPTRRMADRQFVLAGSLYPWEWQWPANVRKFEHVPPEEHAALYSSSRAALNITRGEMARSGYCPSGRFFEAAACGTPVVSDWFEGLDTFFDLDEEIVIADDAAAVIRTLELDESELARIGARARQRALDEHTGEARAKELLRLFETARDSSHDDTATPASTEAA